MYLSPCSFFFCSNILLISANIENVLNLIKFKKIHVVSVANIRNVMKFVLSNLSSISLKHFLCFSSPASWWKKMSFQKTFFHLFPSGVFLIMYIKEIRHEGLWERGCGYLTTSSRSAVGRSGGSGNPPEPANPPPCSRTTKKNGGVTPPAIFQEEEQREVHFNSFTRHVKCLSKISVIVD